MKILLSVLIACAIMANSGYCQTTISDQDEENLEQLSKRLVRMKRSMDGFMKELVSSYSDQAAFAGFGSDVRVDIAENPKDFVVRADLPGMDKDKIVVTLENNRILRISGSRQIMKEETGPNMVKQERVEGKFERTIELPALCKNDGIKASYTNGVLEIVIPKKEETKPEMIKVDVQ